MNNQTIETYLESLGVKVEWKFQGIRPYFPGDKEERIVWEFTLTRGNRTYTSEYGDSIHNTLKAVLGKDRIKTVADREDYNLTVKTINQNVSSINNGSLQSCRFRLGMSVTLTPPSTQELFECLEWYAPEDFSEFCDCYGYDNDSIKALDTFKRCDEQRKALWSLFNELEVERIQEIIQN